MIYFTGDTHGRTERFKDKNIKKLKKGDTLIICGDFGFIWDGSKQEEKFMKYLGKRKYNILFVPGTNDSYSLLEEYPIVQMFGSQVRRISGNVCMLLNGQIYTVEGKKVFAMGGGTTDDKVVDLKEGINWWSHEQPTSEEFDDAKRNLEDVGREVDYIVTHDAPLTIRNFILMDHSGDSNLNYFLEAVSKNVMFKKWFFGCYHMDKIITPSYTCVYCDVVKAL